MSFNTEIYAALIGESTITALVSADNVYFGHLPDNFSNATDSIVYETRIDEALHHIELLNYGDRYNLNIKAVSADDVSIYTIGQAVKDYLKTYETTNVRSVAFERDTYVYGEEDNIHVLSLDFTIDYCN